MRNLRKLTAVVMAIAIVLTSMTAAFAASTTTNNFEAEAGVIKDLGIWTGNASGDLMLDKELTRAEGAVLVLKAVLGKTDADAEKADTAVLSTFVDAKDVPAWAEGWVSLAVDAGIVKGTDKKELNAGDSLLGKDLASMFMNALGYAAENDYGKAVELLAAKSSGTFVDALVAELTNSKLTRNDAAAIVFDAFTATAKDAKANLIETIVTANPSLKDVAVEAGLIAAVPTFKVAGATTKSFAVTFDQAVDTTKASFSVKKGNIVIPVTTTWNTEKTVATLTYGVDFAAGDYTVTVSGLGIEAGKDAATVTVAPERIDSIQVDANGYRGAVTTTTVTVGYKLLNQYGEDVTTKYAANNFVVSNTKGDVANQPSAQGTITVTNVAADVTSFGLTIVDKTFAKSATATVTTLAAKTLSEITLSAPVIKKDKTKLEANVADYEIPYTAKDQYGNDYTLPDLTKLTFVSSDSSVVDVNAANAIELKDIDADSANELTVDFKNFDGPKDCTLTAIVNATGKSSKVTFTVYGASVSDAPALVAPTTRFGANDAAYKVQLTVLDQYGNTMSAANINDAVAAGKFTITSGNASVFTVAGDPVVVDSDKAYVVLTGVATGTANLTVTVNASGKSTTLPITVVDAKYPAAITLVPDYSYAVSGAAIVVKATVKDQYGDALDTSTNYVDLSVDNANFGAVAGTTVTNMVANGVTLNATAYGKTTKLTAKLYNAANASDSTKLVDTKEITLTSVASDAALTYAVTELGTLSDAAAGNTASAYAKDVTVYAKDASGNKVSLVNPIKGVIATTDKVVVNGTKVAAVTDKEGAATISVVVQTNKGVSTLTTTATVSNVDPAIQSITAKAGDTEVTAVSVTSGTSVANLLNSDPTLWFTVTDQYGTTAMATSANIAFFVTNTNGTVTKLGDPATVTFTGTKDQTYTVTAVTNNGLSKAIVVTIK